MSELLAMDTDTVVDLLKYYDLTPAAAREDVGPSSYIVYHDTLLTQTSAIALITELEQVHAVLQYWVSGCSDGSFARNSRLSCGEPPSLPVAKLPVGLTPCYELFVACFFFRHVYRHTCFILQPSCLGEAAPGS